MPRSGSPVLSGMSLDPKDPSIALGGAQDNGTQLHSIDGTWNNVGCGDGGYTAIDPEFPGLLLCSVPAHRDQSQPGPGRRFLCRRAVWH